MWAKSSINTTYLWNPPDLAIFSNNTNENGCTHLCKIHYISFYCAHIIPNVMVIEWSTVMKREREKKLDSSHYYRIRSATAFIQAIMRAQRHINFFVMTATWHSDWERFGKRLIESADFWQHQTEAREKNALLYSIVNGTLNRFTTKYFAALCKIALFKMRAEDFIQWV